MPKTSGVWKIEGVHPAEYAAQWGAGNSGEGTLFYGCSDSDPRTGEVIGNPRWESADWSKFAQVVREQATGVADAIRTQAGRARTGWTLTDIRNLRRLSEWAEYMAGRSRSTLPWLRSTM